MGSSQGLDQPEHGFTWFIEYSEDEQAAHILKVLLQHFSLEDGQAEALYLGEFVYVELSN